MGRRAADRRRTRDNHADPASAAEAEMTTDPGPERAVYGISVASELTGVNPQMLRVYEDRGLLDPHRTEGGTRRYSGNDIERINRIATLLAAGLNLAGVEQVLALEAETGRLRDEIDDLRRRGEPEV
jgi:MerR family transcriptional regulator, heat shock protein HspR